MLTVRVPVNRVKYDNSPFEYWIRIVATHNIIRVKAAPASKVSLQSPPGTVACHMARMKMKPNIDPKMTYELTQARASSRSVIPCISLTSWNFTLPEGLQHCGSAKVGQWWTALGPD